MPQFAVRLQSGPVPVFHLASRYVTKVTEWSSLWVWISMSLDSPKPPLVSRERLQHVVDLASRIAQSQKGFKINPPKMVVDDPSILASEQVVERLMGTTWLMRPDGG